MKYFFLLLLCVVTFEVAAQAIEWTEHSWNQTLNEAAANDQIIFVDIYTTWCGPCIKMDKDVFTDSQVGAYFNKDFISIKLNAEDNAEGSLIAQKHAVNVYPTLLFLNSDGTLLSSATGMKNKYELIALGNESAMLHEHHDLIDSVKSNINRDYNFDELKNILTITRIHPFEGKSDLAMAYLDAITIIAEEDLRIVMGEIDRMDLSYLKRLAPLTASLDYREIYLRRNSQEWINWKISTEKSVYDRLSRYNKENDLVKFEASLEILKGFDGIKSRQIDNLYLDFYRQNNLDKYRTFATFIIEEYIIPTRPREVRKADEEKYLMLQAEIMKDMAASLGTSGADGLFINESSNTPFIDSLSEVYTISRSIAEQLYEISGDFFAFFEDESSKRKASFWASLTHLYYPYDWKYFENHLYILESIGKTEEAQLVKQDVENLPWYNELRR